MSAISPSLGPAAPPGEQGMPLLAHLEELRWRLITSLAAVAVATAICFCFHEPLFTWLARPAAGVQMIITSPIETFKAALLLSVYGGLAASLPVIGYQALAYLAPGLTAAERRWVAPGLALSALLFVGGAAFGYGLLLPAGLKFLLGFAPAGVTPMLSLGEYQGFAASLIFACGAACQLPVALVVASRVGLVTSQALARHRRVAMVAAFGLGMVLSPSPDVMSQGMVAGLLIGLYEASLWLIRWMGR